MMAAAPVNAVKSCRPSAENPHDPNLLALAGPKSDEVSAVIREPGARSSKIVTSERETDAATELCGLKKTFGSKPVGMRIILWKPSSVSRSNPGDWASVDASGARTSASGGVCG